jgi:hypothetical protein
MEVPAQAADMVLLEARVLSGLLGRAMTVEVRRLTLLLKVAVVVAVLVRWAALAPRRLAATEGRA